MKCRAAVAVLLIWGVAPLEAAGTLVSSSDGLTVYDSANNITWLANANTAATNRFGLPFCDGSGSEPCVNASGSMSYPSAQAWVAAMNGANYLGHSDWQLPATPLVDKTCPLTGPNGGSFGMGCTGSALGSLFYKGLGLKQGATAVPIPADTIGPFHNLQPYLYWSQVNAGAALGYNTFSFVTGWVGANTNPHVMYALPMIPGKLSGTPPASGKTLQPSADGQTVYDPVSNVTWAANANLAASNAFGLPSCDAPGIAKICVYSDGAMSWDSAIQLVANMNAANNGAGYLGQKNWELPPIDPNCNGWNCSSPQNPMGELFYGQLGLVEGMPAVATPNVAVGPFQLVQPYLYWSCQAASLGAVCSGDLPAPKFSWSFSFGNGFEGTDLFQNELYVTAYFPGARTPASGPEIIEVTNAEGGVINIAPNTWVSIYGAGLAPAGDTRAWQASDFAGNQMPTQLDHVSVTVNGKSAYVYYISPTQVNILTPPDAVSSTVQVVVTNNGAASATFRAQAQALSPSFFVFNGGPYVAATHADGSLIGPPTLYPGYSTPARPGETIVIYGNGFGPTSIPVVSGSSTQSGTLSPLPTIKIGGTSAIVQFAGLNLTPGEFQFNVVLPPNTPDGDQAIGATYGGVSTQPGALLTIQH